MDSFSHCGYFVMPSTYFLCHRNHPPRIMYNNYAIVITSIICLNDLFVAGKAWPWQHLCVGIRGRWRRWWLQLRWLCGIHVDSVHQLGHQRWRERALRWVLLQHARLHVQQWCPGSSHRRRKFIQHLHLIREWTFPVLRYWQFVCWTAVWSLWQKLYLP